MSSAVTPNSPVPPEPTPAPAHGADEPFTRSLHYEFAGEEGRALLQHLGMPFRAA